MRRLLLSFLPLLLAAQPAWAGQRALYVHEDGKKLTIEVTDDGNAIVKPEGEEQYGILRDGHFYLVGHQDGKLHVIKTEDMAAALDKVMPPFFKQLFDMAAKDQPKAKLRVEPAGTRSVAGHEGQLFKVYGLDDQKPNDPTEMVLTHEASMQPAGQAMEQYSISTVLLMAPLIGKAAGEMVAQMRTIFSYGAPLDMGRFKLTSIETTPIPASAAALPAPPETIDQIVASMKVTSALPK